MGGISVAKVPFTGKKLPDNAQWRDECGSCHLAFSPAMLPASSWKRMMGELQNHFGEDASVDAATAATIEAYLTANAADTGGRTHSRKLLRGVSLASAPQRISELPQGADIVAYCRGPFCVMSDAAVKILLARGYSAKKTTDGISEWQAAGFAVESAPTHPATFKRQS